MVVIRLSRGGTNKRPFYKIVAADRRFARDGRYIERMGYFNPIAAGGEKRIELDRERINYWVGQGAKPSDRVKSLLRELDNPEILEKRKIKRSARKTRKAVEAKAKIEAEAKAKEKESAKEAKSEEEATEEVAKEKESE